MRFRLRVKLAVVALFIALAIPAAIVIYNYVQSVPDNDERPASNITLEPTVADPEDTPSVVTELPPVDEVNPVQDPLLYDFLVGCLDWHVPIHRDTIDSDLYLLRNLTSPEIIYTDWYVMQGGFTVPPTGSSIEKMTLHQRDLDRLETIISELSEEYILHSGDWELIIYAGDAAISLNTLGIVFRDSHKYAEGRVPPFIENGSGWPTDWLRREPYATRLAAESEIDIRDTWWDTFALEGYYPLKASGVSEDGHAYYAVCTGVMQFSFCDDQGNVARGMSWDLLRETCNAMQADILGIYTHNTWFRETE